MKAVIMAGGKGTRLNKYTKTIPKPMIKVNGISLIERQINCLKQNSIFEYIIVVGYLRDSIISYFGDGKKFGITIEYIIENEPLGSAGSLYFLRNKINDDFILIFADLIIDIDFKRMVKFHKANNALLTLFTHPNSHPYDSDLLLIDENNIVIGFDSKNNVRNYYYHNLVNAGVFIVSPKCLSYFSDLKKVDMEHDFISSLIPSKKVVSYRSSEYVKDAGTINRLDSVKFDLDKGIPQKRNLSNPQKCIFLDRDGTINVYKGHLSNINDFILIDGVPNSIKRINSSEYLAIVVTNQPVVSRGEISFSGLENIHKKLETLLGNQGCYLDGIYFCPHYPESGFSGEVKELKINCNCRKPKIGLLIAAQKKFNIDLKSSWFIGDTEVDMQCGKNAGCRTILISNDNKKNSLADYNAKNLEEAIELILNF